MAVRRTRNNTLGGDYSAVWQRTMLTYEELRERLTQAQNDIAERDAFLNIIHQTRMFQIWRTRKESYRKLGVGVDQ